MDSHFKAHLLSLLDRFGNLFKNFKKKFIMCQIKIDSLTAPWIKWGQNEEKNVTSSLEVEKNVRGHFWLK